MRRLNRIAACVALTLLWGCDRSEEPVNGVDTTLPENPAKLTGEVSFPSDYIPDDLRVCAETVSNNQSYCDAQISGGSYTLEVPAGSYRVFAQTSEMPGRRAYYTEFVKCGYYAWCESHEPIEITVQEGETQTGVHPGDWYAQAADAQSGETSESETEETDDPEPVEVPSEDGTEATGEGVVNLPTRSLVGPLGGLFTTDDYPASAMENNEQGTVGYRLLIGSGGRVLNCAITLSSGSAALDGATCSILQRRARFTQPANGQDSVDGRIQWRLQ